MVQNANAALHIAHKGYVMETGRIVMAGTGQELLADEQIKEAYLGRKAAKKKPVQAETAMAIIYRFR